MVLKIYKQNQSTDIMKRGSLIHRTFKTLTALKGIWGFLEVILGVVLWVLSKNAFMSVVNFFFKEELAEPGRHAFSTFILNNVVPTTISLHAIIGIYFIVHGVIKIIIAASLWSEKIWLFPIALILLIATILYELYVLGHSFKLWILGSAILDIAILVLIHSEYEWAKKHQKEIMNKSK